MNVKRTLAAAALASTVVGVPAVALANVGGFDDVPDDHTHAAGIQWLVDHGITVGCDADSFCPSDNLTRAQMGTFLAKLSGTAPGVPPSVNATTVDGIDGGEIVRQMERVSTTAQITNDTVENVTVQCPAGKTAVAGGYSIRSSQNGAVSSDWYAMVDAPTTNGLGWTISIRTLDDAAHDAFVEVHASCAATIPQN